MSRIVIAHAVWVKAGRCKSFYRANFVKAKIPVRMFTNQHLKLQLFHKTKDIIQQVLIQLRLTRPNRRPQEKDS